MLTGTAFGRLVASSFILLLFSCSATRYVSAGSPRTADLSRYVLVVEEASDGRISADWQPLSSFDLSKYPNLASNSHFEGSIVRVAFNRDCEAERDACEDMCKASLKGPNWTHASAGSKDAMCRDKCRPAYLDCSRLKELAEAGKLRVSFPSADSAVEWLKQHYRELLVGSVVVIAGVAFVVASGGGGILVLAPAMLLVSSEVPSAHSFTQVEP
jgi:hypothetical protein